MNLQERLRRLPAVHRLLESPQGMRLSQIHGRKAVAEQIGCLLEEIRKDWLQSRDPAVGESTASAGQIPDESALLKLLEKRLATLDQPRLRRVINASGVILHTNLGRAPLAESAIEQVAEVARGYSNLEFDLQAFTRGSRHSHVEELLCERTGAPAAMAVNNNAAAVLLALTALARGKQVIVSRGELVEIGGSFRIPDVMLQSGARLVEVGTTNKTHPGDYKQAIDPEHTALLLKVHTSNYRIIGFTSDVSLQDLCTIGREHGIPVMMDLGSGNMDGGLDAEMRHWEPDVHSVLKSGVDLVTFSGDKLLGGPQAGILCGSKELIAACRTHPLARALRIDKLTLAALEATLRAYRDPDRALREIPVLRMLHFSAEEMQTRAQLLHQILQEQLETDHRWHFCITEGTSRVGGGALPEHPLPSRLVAVQHDQLSAHELQLGIAKADPPVVARILDDRLVFDPRTLIDLRREAVEISQALQSC